MKHMNTRIVSCVAALSALVGLGVVYPLQAADTPATQPARQEKENPKALEKSMEQMERSFKTLRKQIEKPEMNESSLTQVENLLRATVEAKRHLPPILSKLPDAEKKAKAVEYKQMMISLVRAELDVEDALLEGDNAKAATSLSAVHDLEVAGHTDFRGKED